MTPGSNVAAITRLISAPQQRFAAEELMPLVYQELRRLARARLARLKPGQTVSATELVHEVWLKVAADHDPGWEGKAHFFGAAANAMREILVDQARRRTAKKRDVARREVLPADVPEFRDGLPAEDLLSLHDALAEFEKEHERPAKVVLLRFFAGLSMQEIAEALQISVPTVERDWRFARSSLQQRMGSQVDDSDG